MVGSTARGGNETQLSCFLPKKKIFIASFFSGEFPFYLIYGNEMSDIDVSVIRCNDVHDETFDIFIYWWKYTKLKCLVSHYSMSMNAIESA